LQEPSTDLREHTCEALGAALITALNSCPICLERLDVGPSFPSPLADYLRRTRTRNKVSVTFDYESELFVPVADGEFVLISNGNASIQPIVLPRLARLGSRRDFYELYQDYYYCSKPNAGEVHVIQPATVVCTPDGWKPEARGILEVVEDRPKKNVQVEAMAHQADVSPREERGRATETKEVAPVAACNRCGALVETKYPFCWKCGKPMAAKNESSVMSLENSRRIGPSPAITTEDDATLKHEASSGAPQMFSWALATEPRGSSSSRGSLLKLIAVAAVGLMLLSLGLFVLTRSVSRIVSATSAQPVTPNVQSDPTLAWPADKGDAT
jgi:hypothetical protein